MEGQTLRQCIGKGITAPSFAHSVNSHLDSCTLKGESKDQSYDCVMILEHRAELS